MAARRGTSRDFRTYAADYQRDGVVIVRNALTAPELALVEKAFHHVLSDTGAFIERLYETDEATTIEAPGYYFDDAPFRDVMEKTRLGDIASGIFGGGPVWYVGDQLWMKRGGHAHRTIWHQDSAYEPYSGFKSAVLWVPLESLAGENVLEVVKGSHVGPTYNGSHTTGRNDEVTGIYDETVWPAPLFPDVEAHRSTWNIYSAPMARGDVLVFHENSIHGGAPTSPGQTRRTMSFRMAGDDVVYTPRPPMKDKAVDAYYKRAQGARFHNAFEGLTPGEPVGRGPNIRQVRT
jgi:ectoine hydroxylase-related dioxygenase (phytanoyl-CoA dioxygenase family)